MADSRLHAVIPAAGRGVRLSENGVCGPFMKPLMAINGEPIVARVARQVREAGAEIVTIVVSPNNWEQVAAATQQLDVRLAMQFEPSGPLDALRIGIADWPTHYTLMVSADNLLEVGFIINCVQANERDGAGAIGVDYVRRDEVARFSRYIQAESRWEEGPYVTEQDVMYMVWAGPLLFKTELLANYDRPTGTGEALIGPALNKLELHHLIAGVAYDVGVPEAWEEPSESN